jgi:hypothetical protein
MLKHWPFVRERKGNRYGFLRNTEGHRITNVIFGGIGIQNLLRVRKEMVTILWSCKNKWAE